MDALFGPACLGCSLPRSVVAHLYLLPPMPLSLAMNDPIRTEKIFTKKISGRMASMSAVIVATVALIWSLVASCAVTLTGAAAAGTETSVGVAKAKETRNMA